MTEVCMHVCDSEIVDMFLVLQAARAELAYRGMMEGSEVCVSMMAK